MKSHASRYPLCHLYAVGLVLVYFKSHLFNGTEITKNLLPYCPHNFRRASRGPVKHLHSCAKPLLRSSLSPSDTRRDVEEYTLLQADFYLVHSQSTWKLTEIFLQVAIDLRLS